MSQPSIFNKRPKLVLVHGWGLNSAIWQPLIALLSNDFDCICIDLPGYGTKTDKKTSSDLNSLADELLAEAPDRAYWCAWSLGGMAALLAAKKQPERFKQLNLICTTPRFVQGHDWEIGMDMVIFKNFAAKLKADYQTGIQKFLLLQAGADPQGRALAIEAAELLEQYPAPSSETLSAGLDILNSADLRDLLPSIHVPCQIVSGRRDRIVHPKSGESLGESLPNASYKILNSGHAPHLSCPDQLASLITGYSRSTDYRRAKETSPP